MAIDGRRIVQTLERRLVEEQKENEIRNSFVFFFSFGSKVSAKPQTRVSDTNFSNCWRFFLSPPHFCSHRIHPSLSKVRQMENLASDKKRVKKRGGGSKRMCRIIIFFRDLRQTMTEGSYFSP